MQPHPRIRKTVKWGGAAVTVLLVGVWIGSYFFTLTWQERNGDWKGATSGRIYVGHLYVGMLRGPPLAGWKLHRGTTDLGRIRYHAAYSMGEVWSFPMWPAGAISVCATACGWLPNPLARRARLNHCPKCHYDRAGLAAGAVCPECGAPLRPMAA